MILESKLQFIEEVMDLEKGTLSEDISLDSLEEWDSLAIISFISLVDSKLNKEVDLHKLKTAETVADLIALM